MKKEYRIAFRVTDQEKKRIAVLAKKCGLSVSEYIKQRALGYAPQPVLPEVVFSLLEKIGQLQDLTASPEAVWILDLCQQIRCSLHYRTAFAFRR